MKKHKVTSFTKGWFIGDFAPALLKTTHFEAAMKTYVKGDHEAAHYHEVATEYTVIGSGAFLLNGIRLEAGDIVELQPGEIADFQCLENGVTFVVKSPSAPTDKVVVRK